MGFQKEYKMDTQSYDIKVGDIVSYDNIHARVMRIVEMDDTDGAFEVQLALQEFYKRPLLGDLELIESVKLSAFEPGDLVLVHNIPEHEKEHYGCGWVLHMSDLTDGQPQIVTDVTNHPEEGLIIQIGGPIVGLWFHAYHIEHIENYDIV